MYDGNINYKPAIVDSNFAPATATWRTRRNIRVAFNSIPFASLGENMTSFTKPEVHNLLHCRQRTETRQQVIICTENLVTFGHAVSNVL